MKHKGELKTALLISLMLMLSARALASPTEDMLSDLGKSVPDSARELMGEAEPDITLDAGDVLSSVLGKIVKGLREPLNGALKNGAALVSVSLLCTTAGIFTDKPGSDYIRIAGVAAVLILSFSGISSLIGTASETMNDLYAFGNAVLPVMASASAAAGGFSQSTVKLAASVMFMDILISLCEKGVMPLIYVYIAASAASAAFGGVIKSAIKLVKWCINTALTVLTVSFTVYLTISGLIASSADAAAVKITKTAVSTLLPVVGKLVADASDSVASGFVLIRDAAGVFGILAVIATAAGPFLRLAVNCLVFKAAAALSEPLADDGIAGFITDLGTASGFAMAAVGTSAFMLFISLVSFIKAVGG